MGYFVQDTTLPISALAGEKPLIRERRTRFDVISVISDRCNYGIFDLKPAFRSARRLGWSDAYTAKLHAFL
jgi:hypothetical protein